MLKVFGCSCCVVKITTDFAYKISWINPISSSFLPLLCLILFYVKWCSTNNPFVRNLFNVRDKRRIPHSLCQKLFQQLAQGASQVPQFTSPPWFELVRIKDINCSYGLLIPFLSFLYLLWFTFPLNWSLTRIGTYNQGWQKSGKYSYFPGRLEILVFTGK